MTANDLRNKVVEEFESANLLASLELEASSFSELPRLFESSHFCMRIALNHQTAMAAVSTIAAKLKSDLQQVGVELEYAIVQEREQQELQPQLN